MSEDEGRRSVGLEFGGLEQVREDCRESRGNDARRFDPSRVFGLACANLKAIRVSPLLRRSSLALLRVTLDCLCNWMAMYGPKRRLRRTKQVRCSLYGQCPPLRMFRNQGRRRYWVLVLPLFAMAVACLPEPPRMDTATV